MKQFSNMQKNMEALKGILPEGMDLESLFQSMMNGNRDRSTDNSGSSSDSGKKNADSILQNMMQNASSGDILKNMMSDSQKELYEKFNERFQNL